MRWLIRRTGMRCLKLGRLVVVLSVRRDIAESRSTAVYYRAPGDKLAAVSLWRSPPPPEFAEGYRVRETGVTAPYAQEADGV